LDDRKITKDSIDHVVEYFVDFYNDYRLGAKRRFETAFLVLIGTTDTVDSQLKAYIENYEKKVVGYFPIFLFIIDCESKTPFYNKYEGLTGIDHRGFQKRTIRNVIDPALST